MERMLGAELTAHLGYEAGAECETDWPAAGLQADDGMAFCEVGSLSLTTP